MVITVAAEASVNDEVIFEVTEEFKGDGEYVFEDARFEIIDQIEKALDWEYRVEDEMVDGWESRITIYDDYEQPVGGGYIRA